jgi:hypothetical protein
MTISEFLMTLSNQLQYYIDSKKDDGHDKVKKDFFISVKKLIKNKKLTASTLTELLAQATVDNTKRENLFFLRRKNWLSFNGSKKASINSKAAQWIKTLYHKLNVPLDDISLAEIVTIGITEENKTILKNQPLKRWQKNPLSIRHINAIEHELKGRLSLENYSSISLSQAIVKINEMNIDRLLPLLKEIAQEAPFYLSEVISQLCHYYHHQHPLYTNFIDKIIELGEYLPKLLSSIISSHVNLADIFVEKNPNNFFILSASMQQILLNLWQQNNDKNQQMLVSLEKIKADDALLNHEKYPLLMNLLNDYSYRKAALSNTHEAYLTLEAYQNKIIEKLQNKGLPLIARDYQLTAIKLIDNYLRLHPNAYKSQFFTTLKDRINEEGLTLELLQDHLECANKKLLFAKWSGQHHSRASKLLASLYSQATYDRQLNPGEIDAMLAGNLPKMTPNEHQLQQQSAFDKQLQSVLVNQTPAKPSCLTEAITKEVHYYQSWQRLSQQKQAQKQSVSEVVYQDVLIKKGLQQAMTNQALVADLQGNVLVEVTVTKEDINSVSQGNEKLACIDTLKQYIGQTTLCQLDVRESVSLLEKFRTHLSNQDPKSLSAINTLLNSPHCASIISMTKEMVLHVFLSLRVFEQLGIRRLTADERHALMVEVEQTVLKSSIKSLKDAYQNNHLDIALLNKMLDKSRKDLSKACHDILVDRLCRMIGGGKKDFVTNTLPKLKKELFKATAASNFDYLRTDTYNQIVSRISGTNYTSHDKMLGDDKQGLRFVTRNHYNYNKETKMQTIIPFATPTVAARVPSIALINCSNTVVIPDIVAKFGYSSTKLWLKNPIYQGPIIYNLLTSLHSSVWDASFFEQKNKQRKSAGQILLGAIDFNVQQVQKGHVDKLIYIMNIGVNQHGHQLSYQAIDAVKAEATLMADVAFLSLFSHFSSLFSPALADDVVSTYKQIHLNYVTFLALPNKDKQQCYFVQTSNGKMVADLLIRKKAYWAKCMTKQSASTNFHTLVVQALFHMIINNVHHQLQFGMLVQTLAVMIEPLSLVGCKSANERTECVMGRDEFLKSLNDTINSHPAKSGIMAALTMFINENSDYKTQSNVQKVVDEAYNNYNLQGSATIFSLQDQGAASKITHTTNQDNKGVIKTTEPNTNCAETAYLTFLHQKNSSKMQSHHYLKNTLND